MVRGILLACCLFLVAVQAATAATVTTTVERERVPPGEPVVVTYTVDEEIPEPDFSPLEKDFEILHRGHSRNITLSSSEARVETTWTLVLSPRRDGELTLPPIRLGDALSEARVVSVAGPAAGSNGDEGAEDLFLEVEVDEPSPYVQEQVLYTVRVFHAVGIENATLSTPQVSGGDAVIERIADDRRYQATRGDRRYAVTERWFAIFPQSSGALTIDPVRLSASVRLPAAGGGTTRLWNQRLTRSVQVESDARTLAVSSPPADGPSPWLPARHMALEEDWPDRESIEVGTPITRRIILRADGLMASQLPELELPLSGAARSYPERPRRETEGGARGMNARLEQTMAVIPTQAGTLTLPAVELEWWNTVTDRRETLRLPARTLEITGAPAPVPSGNAPVGSVPAGAEPRSRVAWWLSLGLGLAWLATAVSWWLDRRRAAAGRPVKCEGNDDRASRRRVEKRLYRACRAGDPPAARDALLAWGRVIRPDRPPCSLGALGRITGDPVAGEIAALQRALYAPDAGEWCGEGLYRAAASYRPAPDRRRPDSYTLKPLYER